MTHKKFCRWSSSRKILNCKVWLRESLNLKTERTKGRRLDNGKWRPFASAESNPLEIVHWRKEVWIMNTEENETFDFHSMAKLYRLFLNALGLNGESVETQGSETKLRGCCDSLTSVVKGIRSGLGKSLLQAKNCNESFKSKLSKVGTLLYFFSSRWLKMEMKMSLYPTNCRKNY